MICELFFGLPRMHEYQFKNPVVLMKFDISRNSLFLSL